MRLRIVALGLALATTGCASNPFKEHFGVEAPQLENGDTLNKIGKELDGIAVKLERAEEARIIDSSKAPLANAEGLTTYVALRRNQIDGLCSVFFGGLSEIRNQTRYGRDQFNILAEFTTVMLGLSGAAAEQLAVVSGLQLTANDSIDALERAMLLSPDPHKVHALVQADQRALSRPVPARFSDAEQQVRAYAHPCTFLGIQTVIDRALTSQIDRGTPGSRIEDVRTTLDAIRDALNQGGAGTAIDALPSDLVSDLYWLFVTTPAAGTPERAFVLGRIPATARPRVEAALADSTKQAEIRTLLEGLAVRTGWVSTTAQSQRTTYVESQQSLALAAAETQAQLEKARQAEAQLAAEREITNQLNAQLQIIRAQEAASAAAAERARAEQAAAEAEAARQAGAEPNAVPETQRDPKGGGQG